MQYFECFWIYIYRKCIDYKYNKTIKIMKRTGISSWGILLLTSSALMLTSCATIINDDRPKVVIEGDIDEPVTIITKAEVYKDVTLPIEVNVKRHGIEGQHIQIQSDNHEFEDIVLHKKQSWWTLGNIFSWDILPGMVVDWATNSNKNPRHKYFLISPKGEGETLCSSEPFRMDIPVNRPHANDFYRHELSVSVGSGDAVQRVFDNDLDNHVRSYGFVDDFGGMRDWYYDICMSASVDYMYNINRRLAVGLASGGANTSEYKYNTQSVELTTDDGQHVVVIASYEAYAKSAGFYVLPSVRYKWWIASKSPLALYSQLALGYAQTKFEVDGVNDVAGKTILPAFSTTHKRLGYQATFVGLEVGRGHLRGFVEAGMGYKGYLNLGAKYCF